MMQDNFAHIKAQLSIRHVFEHYGVAVNRHNKALCPIHDEKTASLVLYSESNSWHCFGCGAGGSAIDFVTAYFGLDPLPAAKKLNEDFGLGLSFGRLSRKQKRALAAKRRVLEDERRLVASLDAWVDWAFDGLCRCQRQMEDDWERYAPGSGVEPFHPRYVCAVQWVDYVRYLLDMLMVADFETNLELYKNRQNGVERFATYADSIRKGESHTGAGRPAIA